jgi:pimeloyl-ACP methyl ester carboxylesterase
MGCRVALQAAVTAPSRVAGLVLVDGSSLGDTGAGPGEEAVTEASYDKVLGRVFAAMFPAGDAQGLVPRLVAQARSLPREIGVSLFADLRRWDASNLAPTLARLSRPLLLIQSTVHGDDNSRRSLAAGETSAYLELVRRAVPHARVEIVPGVGHYPQLERPATVNALLEAFAGDLADLADSANLAT